MKSEKFVIFLFFIGLLVAGCIGTKVQQNQTVQSQLNIFDESTYETVDRNFSNLAAAQNSLIVELANNSKFNLEATIVTKEIDGKTIKMYAYNNQIPGPILKVKQGSTIYINFTNNLHENTTVHWHGIRLKNEFDGVPGVTQEPVKPGERFIYQITFPDEGIYWYHPHIREDIQQELGMYGFIQVEPTNSSYYNQVDQEEYLVLDDILISNNDVYPFYKNTTNFALMGRYGNKMFVNGMSNYNITVKKDQAIRFFILNSANVRPFNLSIENTKLKIVGGDGGKFEREFLKEALIIAPSERYIFEAQFDTSGEYRILNKNPESNLTLGTIFVEEGNVSGNNSFDSLKKNTEIIQEIDKYRPYFNKTPDFDYSLTITIPGASEGIGMEHHEDGIEWEDSMFGANQRSTNNQLTWIIKDTKSDKTNMDAIGTVEKNKIIKIRITNDRRSLHPMQHPIHIHGARFLVVKTNNISNDNLVWKDTVLIPVGGSVELLTYFPQEGRWMVHCHIAEHLSSDMMTELIVR